MSTTQERYHDFKLDLLELIAEVQKATDSEAWNSIATFLKTLSLTAMELADRYAVYE